MFYHLSLVCDYANIYYVALKAMYSYIYKCTGFWPNDISDMESSLSDVYGSTLYMKVEFVLCQVILGIVQI